MLSTGGLAERSVMAGIDGPPSISRFTDALAPRAGAGKSPAGPGLPPSAHDLAEALHRIPAVGVGEVVALVVLALEVGEVPLALLPGRERHREMLVLDVPQRLDVVAGLGVEGLALDGAAEMV